VHGCDEEAAKLSRPAPATAPAGRVVISELMYHPAQVDSAVESLEFVELHNAGAAAVKLRGWRLEGGIDYDFGDVTLAAGAYLVVAKDRRALLGVAAYKLDPSAVVGDYQGELANGGERVRLVAADDEVKDEVRYSDAFPWPLAADAFGGGDGWLSEDDAPPPGARALGRSLERISFDVAGVEVSNWDASPVDGPTPGRQNSVGGVPWPIAVGVLAQAKDGERLRDDKLVRNDQPVVITVRFSSIGTLKEPAIEWFVDDVEKEGEPTTRTMLAKQGDAWVATLPPQKDNSIVRYRVQGDRGWGQEPISPRESDPFSYHAYFVTPSDTGKTTAYRMFLSKASWERAWDNVAGGRVLAATPACMPNPTWDARVPAVFVRDGDVFDVQVRYQGSRFNRRNGINIDMGRWPKEVPSPARPSPFRALSWHFNFPRWKPLVHPKAGVVRSFNLNKLGQSCQGFTTTVSNRLFETVGVPAGLTTYARLFINGAYYHYAIHAEHVTERILTRHFGPDHEIGDLFKSVGCNCDEGPYGWGDERLLTASCGFSVEQRYDFTYKRQSRTGWKNGSREVQELIERLHEARAAGIPALRAFFEERFDMPRVLAYMAVINWAGPWDDFFQNHFLYRMVDGKWIFMPIDMDNMFGGFNPMESSFFIGQQGNRSNRENWWNYLKDAFLRAYRPEVIAKLRELDQTVLSPENVARLVDAAAAEYVLEEAMAAPGSANNLNNCGGAAAFAARIKEYAEQRRERLRGAWWD
jgi:hypothetical protein